MTKRWMCLLVCLALLVTVPCVCADVLEGYTSKMKATTAYFGTVCSLTLYDDFTQPEAAERYNTAWEALKALLCDVENAVSVSVPTSDIARYNELHCGESTPVCDITAQIIQKAQEMHQKTEGFYDPTIQPLVDLWGFSPRFTYNDSVVYAYDRQRQNGVLPPSSEEWIQALLPLVDLNGVVLEGDEHSGWRLCKTTPAVWVDGVAYESKLDLGGIAKGYVVDVFMPMLREMGYAYGHLSCGSSSIGLMKTASKSAQEQGTQAYQLQIRRPRETEQEGSAYAMVRAMDCALSSSGDYDFNYLWDGNICCHLINPFTGYPVNLPANGMQQGICTVTLLSGSAMEDDALTTALCIMGPRKALDFYNTYLQGHDIAMVLYRGDESHYEVVTNLDENNWSILDGAYTVASRMNDAGDVVYVGEWAKEMFE